MRDDHDAGHVRQSLARALFIAALAFVAFSSSLHALPWTDADDHVYLADAFVRRGEIDLTRYRAEYYPFHGFDDGARVVSAYTPGAALLFTPLAALAAALGLDPGSVWVAGVLARAAAALWVALAVACIYLALHGSVSERAALALTFGCAFGTAALSVASQAYLQHAPSLGLLALTVLALVRGGDRWAGVAGLPLAMAVAVRQQNALIAIALAAFVLHRRRGSFVRFLLWAVPPLVFQTAYAFALNGSPLPFPLSTQHPGDPLGGLPGLLMSPSRGLLVGSPFLAVGLAALVWSWRWPPDDRVWLARYGSLGMAASLVLFASVGDWWGGHSYGNRYLIDVLPLYAIALGLATARGWLSSRGARWAFGLALTWSVLFHAVGAAGYYTAEGLRWDREPEIDTHPARLWSWSAPQWLSVLRVAVTFHAGVLLVHAAALTATAAAFWWTASRPRAPRRGGRRTPAA